MPSFETTCEFEVYCAKCGTGICNNCDTMKTYTRNANRLEVNPCEKCLQSAHDDGYAEAEEEFNQGE